MFIPEQEQCDQVASTLQSSLRITRRTGLRAVAAALGLSALRPRTASAGLTIVDADYQKGAGSQSFPWAPGSPRAEGVLATGVYEGGPADKYDSLDEAINGARARYLYWRQTGYKYSSTRGFIEAAATKDLNSTNWSSHGLCLDAAAASFFCPWIEGPITVAGVEFNESDRKVIATWRYAGMYRYIDYRAPITAAVLDEMRQRVRNDECVAAEWQNNSALGDWWALVKEVQGENVIMVRHAKWSEIETKEPIIVVRRFNQLGAVVALDPTQAHPNREGNFTTINRQIGGLAIGTHQIAA